MKSYLIFATGMICGIFLLFVVGKTGQHFARQKSLKESVPIQRDTLGNRIPQMPEKIDGFDYRYGQVDYEWVLKQPGESVISLDQYKGKVLFVNLWSTWCGPCISEMPSIDKLVARFEGNANVEFLLITDESVGIVESFLQTQGYGFVFENLEFYSSQSVRPTHLGSRSFPTTYIIDKSGMIRYKHIGSANWDADPVEQYLMALSSGAT